MATVMDKAYRALIERFPLRSIKNDKQFTEAQSILVELGLKKRLTSDENDYFVILGRLLGDYERTKPGVQNLLSGAASLTARELLEGLLEDNCISQREFGREMDIPQSVISDFLSGKRDLSKANALKISKRFGLPVEKFLQ